MAERRFSVCLFVIVLLSKTTDGFPKNTDCGESLGCFSECKGDCTFEVTWRDTGTSVEFTMKSSLSLLASGGNWVAVALSSDKKMEADEVFDCITDGTQTFIQRSQNLDHYNVEVSSPDSWITAQSKSYSNGILMCSFTANKNNPAVNFETDWYLFFATGQYSSTKMRHGTSPKISDVKADFQTSMDLSGGSPQNVMYKLHGIMMISAWILCASIGIVIARYYKPVWLEQKLLGEKVWFTLHRSVMVFAVLFCIAGFVIIFVENKEFEEIGSSSDFKNAHPFIGVIVMCLAIIQPVMAIFRPHPGDKNRFIFNWAHWAVGIVLHFLAVLNIVIGVLLDPMVMPLWVVYIVVAYAAYQIVIETFLELYDCWGKQKDRSQNYEMSEDNSLTKQKNDESEYKFKKMVLIFHVGVVMSFTSALIILVALDLSELAD